MMTAPPLDVSQPPVRKIGRPVKTNGKLDARVTAAITTSEFDRICNEASARRVSVSEIVRILLRRPLPKTSKP